jgi:hypothetical protein
MHAGLDLHDNYLPVTVLHEKGQVMRNYQIITTIRSIQILEILIIVMAIQAKQGNLSN